MEQRYPQSRATPPLTLSPCVWDAQVDKGFERRRTGRTGAMPRSWGGVGAEPRKLKSGSLVLKKYTASRRENQLEGVQQTLIYHRAIEENGGPQ